MALIVALLFCIAFVELFIRLRLLDNVSAIMSVSRQSVAVLTDRSLSDDDKEQRIRRQTLELFKATVGFIAKFVGMCLVLYAAFLLVSAWSASLGENLMGHFVSIKMLALLTAAAMGYVWVRNVVGKKL